MYWHWKRKTDASWVYGPQALSLVFSHPHLGVCGWISGQKACDSSSFSPTQGSSLPPIISEPLLPPPLLSTHLVSFLLFSSSFTPLFIYLLICSPVLSSPALYHNPVPSLPLPSPCLSSFLVIFSSLLLFCRPFCLLLALFHSSLLHSSFFFLLYSPLLLIFVLLSSLWSVLILWVVSVCVDSREQH